MAYEGKLVTVQDVSGQVANGTGAICMFSTWTLSPEACGSAVIRPCRAGRGLCGWLQALP